MVVDFIILYLLFGDGISTEYLHFGLSFAIYAFQTSFWRWHPYLQLQRLSPIFGGYDRSFSAVTHDFKSCDGDFGRGVKPLTPRGFADILHFTGIVSTTKDFEVWICQCDWFRGAGGTKVSLRILRDFGPKQLEIMMPLEGRGFESHPLRQKPWKRYVFKAFLLRSAVCREEKTKRAW